MIPLQTASPHPVTHIVFSPDGAAVAVAQPFHGVTVIERATGRTVAVCAMPRRATLTGLTFCGDGRVLAVAHAKGLEVFDARTGAAVLRNFHYPRTRQLAASGDVVLGATCGNETVLRKLLTVADTTISLLQPRAAVYRADLAFLTCAPDGSRLLSASGNRFVLLDASAGRTIAEIECPTGDSQVKRVAKFCPLGRRFAVNDGRTLDVYDAPDTFDETGDDEPTAAAVAPMPHTLLAPVFTLKPDKPAGSDWCPPFALLADGRGLLVKRPRNRVQLWDSPTGTLVNEWSWQFEWVTCVAVCADGLTAVAGGRFGRVLLWDLE